MLIHCLLLLHFLRDFTSVPSTFAITSLGKRESWFLCSNCVLVTVAAGVLCICGL